MAQKKFPQTPEQIMNKTAKPVEIDFNPEFKRAPELMEETDIDIFITGRAKKGTSTFIQKSHPSISRTTPPRQDISVTVDASG